MNLMTRELLVIALSFLLLGPLASMAGAQGVPEEDPGEVNDTPEPDASPSIADPGDEGAPEPEDGNGSAERDEPEVDEAAGTDDPNPSGDVSEGAEDDFEDNEDGFESQESGVRFQTSEPGFTIERTPRPLEHRFLELVEFEDLDADGAYDPGEPVLARMDLTGPPDVIAKDLDKREIQYGLPAGNLSIVVEGRGDATKFSVEIRDYRYQQPTSLLALASRISVNGGVQVVDVDGEPAVAGSGTGDVPYLSWTPHVDVTSGRGTVVWSVLASLTARESSALVYWAYPHSANITHDPLLGVTQIAIERLLDTRAFGLAAVFGAAVLAIGYAARRRNAP